VRPVILVGAGGHAKAIVETLRDMGTFIAAYIDPKPAPWLDARQVVKDQEVVPQDGDIVLGMGAVDPAGLCRRLKLLDSYLARGFVAQPVVHRAAHVSADAILEAGVVVLAGAVIQPGAIVGRGSIVNTGAIVEHDSLIGMGTHVAPGAVVLGDCRVGECSMIGAGAVLLQACSVPEETLISALTRIGQRYS
jgi:sugar O-acyltransferase (sialic acid O-acetyltransferase NeuD family)